MAVIFEVLEAFEAPTLLLRGSAAVLLVIFLSHFFRELADGFPYRDIPLVGKNRWELSNKKAKERFINSAHELIQQGFSQGRATFQVMFSYSLMIVLHPRLINEIKSHPHLSFEEAIKRSFFKGKIPGFEAFEGNPNEQRILIEVINKKINQNLGNLIVPLSRETSTMLKDTFDESKEWQPFVFAKEVPHMVARLSSLIFLGKEVSRDKEWLDVSVNYAIDAFLAARELRMWPAVLRYVVHWVLPATRRIRDHMRVGGDIVNREIKKREMIREGKLPDIPKEHPDVLDWFQEIIAGRPFNQTRAQIGLSLAAIHTTSGMLTNLMYDLTAYPEYIQFLRNEIKTVLEEDGGLKKSSLSKMKLLDSVMKESQRVNPTGLASIHRVATQDIPLSDGTIVPKGASVVVSGHMMHDESVYPDAQKFDGFRFYTMRREAGQEHRHQFVSTSPEHFGFGHGMHACPGRFFAAYEIKVFIIHLLLKYDWQFATQQGRPKSIQHGIEIMCDPNVELLFRPRQPEIDLALLGETVG